MSRTISPGLVDASHWTYVAAVMASSLDRAAEQLRVKPLGVPPGVLDAARDFFRMVVEATGSGVPSNPVATAANYSIAARALRATKGPQPLSRNDINDSLRSYKKVLDELNQERSLREEDSRKYREIATFFRSIAQSGETQAYEHYASLPDRGA